MHEKVPLTEPPRKIARYLAAAMGKIGSGKGRQDGEPTPEAPLIIAKDVAVLMSNEQRRRSDAAARAMAKRYDVDVEEFGVVATKGSGGEDRFTTLYMGDGQEIQKSLRISPSGELSWNHIFKDRDSGHEPQSVQFEFDSRRAADNYKIEIDGQTVDTRDGMTEPVYRAFILGAEEQKLESLRPRDSIPVVVQTLLTGQYQGRKDNVSAARIDEAGEIVIDHEVWRHQDNGFGWASHVEFRPGIETT